MVVILGGGISGISASYHLNQRGIKNIVLEKRSSPGGLLDNFTVGPYLFDHFIHLSFTTDEYVKKLFSQSTNYITHHPDPWCWKDKIWIKHPIQNNLFPIDAQDKVRYIQSFLKIKKKKPKDYREWLYQSLGEELSLDFAIPYTRKYWCLDPEKLATSWVGSRVYRPSVEEVLYGAMTDKTPITYYAKEMRYPISGGYKSFLTTMVDNSTVETKFDVQLIDMENKYVVSKEGKKQYFENLINTIPLPALTKLIKNCPKSVISASSALEYTSGTLVSLGFKSLDSIPPYLWFYIYDNDFLPARAYSSSMKSTNNAPSGHSSLQFEIYSRKDTYPKVNLQSTLNHTIEQAGKKGLIDISNIDATDVRNVEYANVAITNSTAKNRAIIKNWLTNRGILLAGRFGEWAYLWSDQSLLSGKKAADNILQIFNKAET